MSDKGKNFINPIVKNIVDDIKHEVVGVAYLHETPEEDIIQYNEHRIKTGIAESIIDWVLNEATGRVSRSSTFLKDHKSNDQINFDVIDNYESRREEHEYFVNYVKVPMTNENLLYGLPSESFEDWNEDSKISEKVHDQDLADFRLFQLKTLGALYNDGPKDNYSERSYESEVFPHSEYFQRQNTFSGRSKNAKSPADSPYNFNLKENDAINIDYSKSILNECINHNTSSYNMTPSPRFINYLYAPKTNYSDNGSIKTGNNETTESELLETNQADETERCSEGFNNSGEMYSFEEDRNCTSFENLLEANPYSVESDAIIHLNTADYDESEHSFKRYYENYNESNTDINSPTKPSLLEMCKLGYTFENNGKSTESLGGPNVSSHIIDNWEEGQEVEVNIIEPISPENEDELIKKTLKRRRSTSSGSPQSLRKKVWSAVGLVDKQLRSNILFGESDDEFQTKKSFADILSRKSSLDFHRLSEEVNVQCENSSSDNEAINVNENIHSQEISPGHKHQMSERIIKHKDSLEDEPYMSNSDFHWSFSRSTVSEHDSKINPENNVSEHNSKINSETIVCEHDSEIKPETIVCHHDSEIKPEITVCEHDSEINSETIVCEHDSEVKSESSETVSTNTNSIHSHLVCEPITLEELTDNKNNTLSKSPARKSIFTWFINLFRRKKTKLIQEEVDDKLGEEKRGNTLEREKNKIKQIF